MIKFRHIDSANIFNSLKFSAGKNNTLYYIGKDTSVKHTGVPDVLYTELAFCRELRVIYTHGGFYENQKGTYLKQIDNLDGYLQASDGEIVEYIGQTNCEYVNGYLYRNVISQTTIPIRRILTSSNENIIQQGDTYYFKQELTGEVVYANSSRSIYCYGSPIIGTKIYESASPINEYVITSTTPVTGGYQVNYSPIDDYSISNTVKLVGMAPKMLWVSTNGTQVCAAPGEPLTGIVEVEGDRYVDITSEFVQNKNNYWELVLPSSISGGGSAGGFRKIQVNNSEIDSVNYDSFKLKNGNGIELECRNNEIVINRLSEINDSTSSSTTTWSSEKISSVISAFSANTFLVVDELPTTDIDPKVIYIVPKEGGESPNLREEYVYINGNWELIGSTDVDLSNYYNIQEVDNRLSTKQDKLTAIGLVNITDNNISVDLTQYYTKDAVDSKLAVKQNIVTGAEGEVLYHNGSDVFTQFVMSDGYAVETEEDLALCKNFRPSFKEIFDTWYQFSHKEGADHAGTYGSNGDYYWVYDEQNERIRETINSKTYTGYVSPRSYSNYDVTVRCFSTNSDDDTIGLVAAFAKDANGKEHTLSFLRTPGGTATGNGKWFAVLDYSQFAIGNNSDIGQVVLAVKEYSFPSGTPKKGWNYYDSTATPPIDLRPGTIINMVRSGNVFTAKCSQFGSSIIDPNSTITIDLDQLSETYPTLSLFKGSASWGYSCMSQMDSQYENISVTDPSALIFDILNNQVWSYDPLHDNEDGTLGAWRVIPGSPINMMGIGRFNYNSITDKLFFNDGKKITRIASKLEAGDHVEIVNGVISATVPEADTYDIKDLADSTNLKQTWNNKQDPVTGTGVISVNNNEISADLSDYYTKETTDGLLAGKQNKLTGVIGDVMYHTGSDILPQQIMSEGYVATTEEDLALTKGFTPSFQEIFSTWTIFSHFENNDRYQMSGGLHGWSYDPVLDTVTQPNNSKSLTGFVSPKAYSNYNITVRVYSDDIPENSPPHDNDTLGLVAAFAKDSNGKEHTLTFLRCIGGDGGDTPQHGSGLGSYWACYLDYRKANGGTYIKIAEGKNLPGASTNANKAWDASGTESITVIRDGVEVTETHTIGSVINIVRDGNVFTAKCSAFGSRTVLDSTLLTVDLDQLIASGHPEAATLALFRGASQWGYATQSQPDSKYENISVTNNVMIYDFVDDEVLTFDSSTNTWKAVTGAKPLDYMGAGRLNYNSITGKLFYNNGHKIQELNASSSSETPTPTTANDSTITLTQGGNLVGSFTLNQATNTTIDFPASSATANDSTITLTQDGNVIGSFTLNQASNATIDFPASSAPASVNDSTITLTQGGNPVGSFTLNQALGETIDFPASSAAANDSTITLTQGGNTVGSFTLNQATNTTIDFPASSSSTTYTSGDAINIDSSQGNSVNVLYDDTSIILNSQGKLEAKHKIQQISEADYNSSSFTPDPNTLYLFVEA